jgi:hypothetical protein
MSEDRFSEITACNAAKKAVKDFDAKHAAKAEAIKQIAKMLERGGWSAVQIETEAILDARNQRLESAPDIEPVPQKALDGDRIETIVNERRRLMQEWERAYQAVPEPIRASAPNPYPSRGALATPRGRPPHG